MGRLRHRHGSIRPGDLIGQFFEMSCIFQRQVKKSQQDPEWKWFGEVLDEVALPPGCQCFDQTDGRFLDVVLKPGHDPGANRRIDHRTKLRMVWRVGGDGDEFVLFALTLGDEHDLAAEMLWIQERFSD